MTTLRSRFENLEDSLNMEMFERSEEIHTSINAILSRKHHFQVGPPGTGKTMLVDRLTKRIGGLGEGDYFRWLLTSFSSPEELFGGPDFKLLREEGIYRRVTEGKLPQARFVFLDEIFKANAAILNANLTAMNERLFHNGTPDARIPLISLFSASNELPESEALWALWDRLHFRHEIGYMVETGSYIRMLSERMDPEPEASITLEDIYDAHSIVDKVMIPEEIFEAMHGLRTELRDEGIEVTDRRWVESLGIIRAEAFLNDRDYADIMDMRPLMHVLWSDLDHQKIVRRKVLELANPIDREASDILERIEELEAEFKSIVQDGDNPKAVAKQAIEIHNKVMKAAPKIKELEAAVATTGRKSEYLGKAKTKFLDLGRAIMSEGFGVTPEDIS